VRSYRQRNPYYHFAVAQSAFAEKRFDKTLVSINRAINIKGRDSRFYFLNGLAEQNLGDENAAKKSFAKARRYGARENERRRNAQGYTITG
jgi:Flp pilus assembly protein TadD